MSAKPDPATAEVLTQLEEGLRRRGFAESTIKRLRKANRAAAAALAQERKQP